MLDFAHYYQTHTHVPKILLLKGMTIEQKKIIRVDRHGKKMPKTTDDTTKTQIQYTKIIFDANNIDRMKLDKGCKEQNSAKLLCQ